MTNICLGCNEPTLDGQQLNGLLRCHWDCTEKTRVVLGEAVANELVQQRVDARLRADGLTQGTHSWIRLGGSV